MLGDCWVGYGGCFARKIVNIYLQQSVLATVYQTTLCYDLFFDRFGSFYSNSQYAPTAVFMIRYYTFFYGEAAR